MYQIKFIIFVLFNLLVLSSCTTKSSLISEPIDDLLKDYDPRFRPNFGKHAVNVRISAYIMRLYDYSDSDNVNFN
jgi:hypothetical protein